MKPSVPALQTRRTQHEPAIPNGYAKLHVELPHVPGGGGTGAPVPGGAGSGFSDFAHVYGGRRRPPGIRLTLSGSRPIAMLRSQLEKLHTVVDVVLQEPAASVRSVSA